MVIIFSCLLNSLPLDRIIKTTCGKGNDCSTACRRTDSEVAATCLNIIYKEDLWKSTDILTSCTGSKDGSCDDPNYLQQQIDNASKMALIHSSPLQQ